jgi:4'-phosphopantetheinyl transferase
MINPTNCSRLEYENVRDEVHIWALDLDHLQLPWCGVEQMLPESERKKSERFRFETISMRYIKRHYLLRVLLGRYLGTEFYEQEFHRNEQGKPSLKNEKGCNSIYFNLSHSENMCIFAFTKEGEVGVDVEKIYNLSDMVGIVERCFSLLENKKFRLLPEHSRKKTFFTCWTRKEALLKALGVGLSFPANQVDVLAGEDEASRIFITTKNQNSEAEWTLQDINILDGFASALALEGTHFDCSERLRYFKFDDKITIR